MMRLHWLQRISELPWVVLERNGVLIKGGIHLQNISIALGLKVIALLLIIPGWLTLWMAVMADMGATVIVVLNSLRLMRNRL